MGAFLPIMMGAQLGMNVWDKYQSAQATKDMSSFLDKRESDLNASYLPRINQNYLDTAEASGITKRIRDTYGESLESMKGGAISSGATAEAKVAAKDGIQENYARALSQLAGYGTQRKDRLNTEYQGMLSGIAGQRAGMIGQQQASSQAIGQNINSSFGNIFQAYGEGAFDDMFKN